MYPLLQDLMGESSCSPCPAGYYCVANSTTYSHQICPVGHYCPEGTEYDIQNQCPPGTYNNFTGMVIYYYSCILNNAFTYLATFCP